jgi:DNA-binding MarR family transcriptional regulator
MTLSQSLHIQSAFCATPLQEIDVELFAFVERYATNLARWDLLLYFGQNPNLRGDAPEIAGRIGRKLSSVQKELDDLTYLGVLQAAQGDPARRYILSRDVSTRRAAIRMAHDFSVTH